MALKDLFSKTPKRTSREIDDVQAGAKRYIEDPNRPTQKAIIYQSELDYISRCILDYTNIETGGQLFGFWTATGTPIVVYAIGPGLYSRHNPTSFVQDQAYLRAVGMELHKRYRLQHVGEWHSHHQLGLAHPSGGDVNTMQYGVGKPGFPRLLLCIGNCTPTHTTINAFNFHENTPGEYVHASWDIINIDSPYRLLVDDDLHRILIHPTTKKASHGQLRTTADAIRENSAVKIHWLTEDVSNVEMMKSFVSTVQSLFPNNVVKAEIIKSGEPQIAIKGVNINICLPFGFPDKSPLLVDDSGGLIEKYNGIVWDIEEEPLKTTFEKWVKKVFSTGKREIDISPKSNSNDVVISEYEDNDSGCDSQEYIQAKTRTERLGEENMILSEYFHQDAFLWSGITDEPVLNIVAFPFSKKNQAVVRMTIPSNFPSESPKIQIGFYKEDVSPTPTLPKHLAEINYFPLSGLFEGADVIFHKLLSWCDETSIFKSYVITCIMIYYYYKGLKDNNDGKSYISSFMEDKQKLNNAIAVFSEKIKENKQ